MLSDRLRSALVAGCLVALGLLATPSATEAQDRRTVLLVPTGVQGVDPGAAEEVVDELADQLSRSLRPTIQPVVVSPSELPDEASLSWEEADAMPAVRQAAEEQDTVHYKIFLEVGRSGTALLAARTSVATSALQEVAVFSSEGRDPPELAEEINRRLAIRVFRRIRIGMLEFPMRRGDDEEFGGLDRALTQFLGEGLKVSSRIVLVESLDQALVDEEVADQARSGVLEGDDAVELGREMDANYLIMGEYWELGGTLRIHVRCVNVETREVVLIQGVSVPDPSVETLDQEMTALAAELRSEIENDFIAQPDQPSDLAVSAFPPFPNTAENREIALELVRTLSRKLQALDREELRVREDPTRVATYLNERRDRWLMSRELGADRLLTLSLDRRERDRLVMNLDVFVPESPDGFIDRRQFDVPVDEVDPTLTGMTRWALETLGVPVDTADTAALAGPSYRGIYDPLGFHIQGGPTLRGDGDLFLGIGGGITLEGGATWIPFSSGRWMVQPMNLRFDIMGKRRSRWVIGGDLIFATVTHRFRPHLTLNPYVGASAGYLGVFRGGSGGSSYDARLGFGLVAGIEHTLSSSRTLTYQVQWSRAFNRIPAQTLGTATFPGGRPGGLSFTLGTSIR